MTNAPAALAPGATDPETRTDLLRAGDRVPDFLLPDQNKKADPLYGLVGGQPVVLHFYPGHEKKAFAVEFDAFRERWPDLAKRKVALFAVNGEPLPANIERAGALSLPFALLTDPGGRVQGWFGVPQPDAKSASATAQRGIVTYLLDTNLRVMTALRGRGERAHAEQVIEALDSGPVLGGRHAPILLIPRVLDRAMCRRLMDLWHSGGNVATGTISMGATGASKTLKADVKRRRDHLVQDPALLSELNDLVFRRVATEVDRAFGVQITAVEEYKIVRYDSDEGGFFRPHRDNTVVEKAHRRFAMTLNLNSEEYEGGELSFPEYGPARYKPDTGEAAIFSCSLMHEAHDVSAGKRFVLLSFILDGQSQRWRTGKANWFRRNIGALEEGLRRQAAAKPRR